MNAITYETFYVPNFEARVYLDGRRVGTIYHLSDDKWQYWPKGSRSEGGPRFDSLEQVKQSLEGCVWQKS